MGAKDTKEKSLNLVSWREEYPRILDSLGSDYETQSENGLNSLNDWNNWNGCLYLRGWQLGEYDKPGAAIFYPAFLGGFEAGRGFFAIADGHEPFRRDALID